jgi:hypothetical protein
VLELLLSPEGLKPQSQTLGFEIRRMELLYHAKWGSSIRYTVRKKFETFGFAARASIKINWNALNLSSSEVRQYEKRS